MLMVVGQHRELHVDIHRFTRQRIVDHLALLEQLAIPQVLQLLGKRIVHLTRKMRPIFLSNSSLLAAPNIFKVSWLMSMTHLLHAARDELGMHFDERLEITDALGTHAIHEVLDGRKILHPQRNRRMLEQIAHHGSLRWIRKALCTWEVTSSSRPGAQPASPHVQE